LDIFFGNRLLLYRNQEKECPAIVWPAERLIGCRLALFVFLCLPLSHFGRPWLRLSLLVLARLRLALFGLKDVSNWYFDSWVGSEAGKGNIPNQEFMIRKEQAWVFNYYEFDAGVDQKMTIPKNSDLPTQSSNIRGCIVW
jgi:hypothetical protein